MKLIVNPLSFRPENPDYYDEMEEVVELCVGGFYVISVMRVRLEERAVDTWVYQVNLWKLPEFAAIDDIDLNSSMRLDIAWLNNLSDALKVAYDSVNPLLEVLEIGA